MTPAALRHAVGVFVPTHRFMVGFLLSEPALNELWKKRQREDLDREPHALLSPIAPGEGRGGTVRKG